MASLAQYEKFMAAANGYHAEGKWEEKLNALQQAEAALSGPDFPENDEYRYKLGFEFGTVYRRWGQYERAENENKALLDKYPNADPAFQASVYGELGLISRHRSNFKEARQRFSEQGRLAGTLPSSIEADAEICRAIGNEGIAVFNLWQNQIPQDPATLRDAIDMMRKRVSKARELQERVKAQSPGSKYLGLSETWETVGLNRLALLYIAAGDTKQAVAAAKEGQDRQTGQDPTVSAYSAFFMGNALWHDGQKEAALKTWNAPPGTSSPPVAFAKEPGEEHNGYMRLMAEAGVDFDVRDESGSTALDYAILGDSKDAQAAVPIVEGALRRAIEQKLRHGTPGISDVELQEAIGGEISNRKRQAELRRQYRTILQEQIRPEMRVKKGNTFRNLRSIYAKFVTEDTKGRTMFSSFRYVRYTDFKNHGSLPESNSGLVEAYSDTGLSASPDEELFVIFFSYRWLGEKRPDDDQHTQWKRMVRCAEAFLSENPSIKPDKLAIWLDLACIDQNDPVEKQRGVDALPLAVTQCNAMISLVGDAYYTRAWCVTEVMLIRALERTYGLHVWREESNGTLQKVDMKRVVDTSNLDISNEEDRPNINFLLRQSVLLGKDDA